MRFGERNVDPLADLGALGPRRGSAIRDASPPAQPPSAKPNDQRPTITFQQDKLTVQVQNRPLEWVLHEISRIARLAIVRAPGAGSQRVTLQLRDVPVDEGLRQILVDHDAFYFYGIDKKAPASLRVVWVYPKGRGRGLVPIPAEEWASTKELRQEATTNPDPARRARAVEALVERSGDQALDTMLAAFRDADEGVRTRALYGALSAGVGLPADSLAGMALGDPSPKVRFLALEALAINPGTVDLRTTAQQLLTDPDPLVRQKAGEILRQLDPVRRPQSAPPGQRLRRGP